MRWVVYARDGNINERVKNKIRSSSFLMYLFRKFKVPVNKIDTDLDIITRRLKDNFCQANEDTIVIDDRLANASDFLTRQFHFVAHEILHWLRRQVEKQHYFGDPEEIEGFNVAIAYSLCEEHNDEKTVAKRFFPLIQITIKDDKKALEFLKKRITDAKKLLAEMSN